MADIEQGVAQCNTLVYGYAVLDGSNNKIRAFSSALEADGPSSQYKLITNYKTKFPNLKVLLSLGGGYDELGSSEKYFKMIETTTSRLSFLNSVVTFLKNNNFDGLDLAFQFPKTKPKKKRSGIGSAWYSFKKTIGAAGKAVDPDSEAHKAQFTSLVEELKASFKSENLMLSVTVLPNVDSNLYLDIPEIKLKVDFITISPFDVITPERNPNEADFPAPLYELPERDPTLNVDHQVTDLMSRQLVPEKIFVGIPTYGRTWKLEKDAAINGYPPLEADGAYSAGNITQVEGLLSYAEICSKMPAGVSKDAQGEDVPLTKTTDPTKRMGTYAFRKADDKGKYGIWVGYEEPDTAGYKAAYVKTKALGGVAIFDLTNDDVFGTCGKRFPIVSQIKQKLY